MKWIRKVGVLYRSKTLYWLSRILGPKTCVIEVYSCGNWRRIRLQPGGAVKVVKAKQVRAARLVDLFFFVVVAER